MKIRKVDSLALILFFMSGCTALIYQVLWMKELGLLFGNGSYAAAVTLATFFLGLAAGAKVWGSRVEHIKRPLCLYGALEGGVAVSIVIFLGLLKYYYFLYPTIYQSIGDNYSLFLIFKFILSITLLFPSAFFMGGTFPALSDWYTGSKGMGKKASMLYAVNTLGAVLGVCAAGFWLPPIFGYNGTYLLTLTITIIIAVVAWRYGKKFTRTTVVPCEDHPDFPALSINNTSLLAFISGFTALSLEVLWIRMFAQIMQNTVYTFAAILCVFLISLALGSSVSAYLAGKRLNPLRVLSNLCLGAAVFIGSTPFVFSYITGGLLYTKIGNGLIHDIITVGSVIMIPGIILGTVFPYLMKISEPVTRSVGKKIGDLFTFNTLGSIVGSIFAGFIILELFGTWIGIVLIATVYFLMALFVGRRYIFSGFTRVGTICCSIILIACGIYSMRIPQAVTDPGRDREIVVEAWHGSQADVAVIREGNMKRIRVNSHYTLGGVGAREQEEFQAHLPLLLHPSPRNVFFLGMGTGITAGAALQHPVQKVIVSELIPEVVLASEKYFSPYTNGLFADPRVTILTEDGRNYLLGTDKKFDVIIGDLFLPWKRGTGSLYALEHFHNALERLNQGGYFAQWIPLYQVSEYEFGVIARTMIDVFPQVTLWRGDFNDSRSRALIVGHKDASPLDPQLLKSRVENSIIVLDPISKNNLYEKNVRELFMSGTLPVRNMDLPLFYYCGNLTGSSEIFDQYPQNTDNRPVVEYSASRLRTNKDISILNGREFVELLRDIIQYLPLGSDPYLKLLSNQELEYIVAGYRLHWAQALRNNGQNDYIENALASLKSQIYSEKDVAALFAPITDLEQALAYYRFRVDNIGSPWEQNEVLLIDKDDYHSEILHTWISDIEAYKQLLNNRVTEVKKIVNGYRIYVVGFDPAWQMEFFEKQVDIFTDGKVVYGPRKSLGYAY